MFRHHEDHSEAVPELLAPLSAPLAAGRGEVDVKLAEGVRFGLFYRSLPPGMPSTTSR